MDLLFPRELLVQIAAKNRAALLLFRQTCRDFATLTGEYPVNANVDLFDLPKYMEVFTSGIILLTVESDLITKPSPRRIASEPLLVGKNPNIFTSTKVFYASSNAAKWLARNFPLYNENFAVDVDEAEVTTDIIAKFPPGEAWGWLSLSVPYTMCIFTVASNLAGK